MRRSAAPMRGDASASACVIVAAAGTSRDARRDRGRREQAGAVGRVGARDDAVGRPAASLSNHAWAPRATGTKAASSLLVVLARQPELHGRRELEERALDLVERAPRRRT